jgi:threonine/homoserine/homoserine lactone efflux protein
MAGVDAANRPRCMGRQQGPRASRKAWKGTCLNLLPPLLALLCMTVFTKFRISQSSCRARWYLIKCFLIKKIGVCYLFLTCVTYMYAYFLDLDWTY